MSVSTGRLFGPISDVQGFSMRDGLTHLEIQERMRHKLLELIAGHATVIKHVVDSEASIESKWAEMVIVLGEMQEFVTTDTDYRE